MPLDRQLAAGDKHPRINSPAVRTRVRPQGAKMDLSSRWDRCAVTFLLLVIGAMTGCQGLFGNGSGPSQSSVVASSPSLDFGPVVVGGSKTLPDTLTNGTAATVIIASASVSDSQFRITAPSFPLALNPGQTATMSVSFTPHAAGKPSGKLALMSAALRNGEMDLAIDGDALSAGKLAVTPGSVAFGNVRVGQSQAQSATLTNSGESSVTISQASASSGAFSLTGLTFPLTLAAGQTAPFTVVFTPKTAGPVSGNISVNGQASLSADVAPAQHNAATAPTTAAVAVSGDGTTAGSVSVDPIERKFRDGYGWLESKPDRDNYQLGRDQRDHQCGNNLGSWIWLFRTDASFDLVSGSKRTCASDVCPQDRGRRDWQYHNCVHRDELDTRGSGNGYFH